MTRWFTLQDFFSSPQVKATAWVSRYSTSVPGGEADRIETGHGFGRLAVDGDAIWVTNAAGRSVARIDGGRWQLTSRADLRRTPTAIAVGRDAIWVVCSNGWLWRFRSDGEGEGVARLEDEACAITCDRTSVWTLHANGRLVSLDQATSEITTDVKIRRGGQQLLFAGGALLALSANGSRVSRISTSSGEFEVESELPARGVRAAVLGDTAWVACGRRRSLEWGALAPIDPTTMAVGPPLELPGAPRALAAGGDAHLWVACGRRRRRQSRIVRVEPRLGEVTAWSETDWTIYDLAVAGEQLIAATGLTLAGPAAGMADSGLVFGGPGGGHHGGGEGGGGGS